MTTPPYDAHALSGAYAVDALDDDERAAFEAHLAECAECRAEVAGLREAASRIADTTAVAPPARLRERVLSEITTVRPLPPAQDPEGPEAARAPEVPEAPEGPGVAAADPGERVRPAADGRGGGAHVAGRGPAGRDAAQVVPLAARRRRLATTLVAVAAAAALIVGGVVGIRAVWDAQQPQEHRISATEAVLDAADARSTSVDFPRGATATVTHSDELGRAVIVVHHMPAPPAGKVYQLWLDQPGEGMVPAGLMPAGSSDTTLLLKGDAATATAAGITVEPAGGSAAPTSDPIALFDFGSRA